MEETSKLVNGQLLGVWSMACTVCSVFSLPHKSSGSFLSLKESTESLPELGDSFQQPTCVLASCAVPVGIPEDRKYFLGVHRSVEFLG